MLVVDASLLAAAFAEEEHSDFARGVLRRYANEGFMAPALIRWELASIIWKKFVRGEFVEVDLSDFARYLDAFDLQHPDDPNGDAVSALARIARVQGLSTYDAAYFNLAVEQASPLGTIDRRLTAVALAAGLTVLSPFA